MTLQSYEPLITSDIGGTNARFAIVASSTAAPAELKLYRSETFPAFSDALANYLQEITVKRPRAIAIGAAGPIENGAIALTNSSWRIEPRQIEEQFGLVTATLANDLVAMAAGISRAPVGAFVDLAGAPARVVNRCLVIAIGTGLGVAWYQRHAEFYVVHSSEAGHMAFSPTSDIEAKFVKRATARHQIMTFEDMISGSGIQSIYERLRTVEPQLHDTEAVFAAAEAKDNSAAEATISLIIYALCTFTRNLAAALGGVDEIVFAGGIGRRIRSHLHPDFLARLHEGREIPLDMTRIGVRIALDDSLPLIGAANLAYGLVQTGHATDSSS